MSMTHKKTTGASLLSALSADRENAAALKETGFTMLELLITVAIIAILGGFAAIGIRDILPGMRANGAMYKVEESLREARMLAMSENRDVRIEFSTTDNRIEALIMADVDLDELDDASWADIAIMVERGHDPSTDLGGGHKFISWSGSESPTPDSSRIAYTPNPDDNIALSGVKYVFKPNGLMTDINDVFSPINGTVFIGPPASESDPMNRFVRAVTILGATGRITGWQLRNGEWRRAR